MEEKGALAATPAESADQTAAAATTGPGLTFTRRLSKPGVEPWTTVDWETRDATIQGEGGKIVFEQRGVEFPSPRSSTARRRAWTGGA